MSLNGLDDVKVKETYDAAVAEPGGWFLLKYISRDEVAVLGQGNGGIVEFRDAIAAYEEESPLFGFLRYRRRKVLIKYVPEGCSRLVQARATVHFNAIAEKFSPHDTIFPISTAKELKDSTLSAACKLHAASGSTSSSTSSIRRRQLMEIEEEAEDDKRQTTVMEDGNIPLPAPSSSLAESERPLSSSISMQQSTAIPSSTMYGSLIAKDESLSSLHPSPSAHNMPRSPTPSIGERRASSQSQRLNIFSLNMYGRNERPKVKLRARPSLDSSGRSYATSSGASYRPVSTLPAGLKLFSRSSKKTKDSEESQTVLEDPIMTVSGPAEITPSIPEERPLRPHTSGGRPTTSSGSSIKGNLSLFPSAAPKMPAMTPEKVRLMKALQLRKKMQLAAPGADPILPSLEQEISAPMANAELVPLVGDLNNKIAGSNNLKEGDSGIAIELHSTLENADSDATRTISTPASPVEPQEAASTEASSISESTEETVREAGMGLDESSAKSEQETEKEGASKIKTTNKEAAPSVDNNDDNSSADSSVQIRKEAVSEITRTCDEAVPSVKNLENHEDHARTETAVEPQQKDQVAFVPNHVNLVTPAGTEALTPLVMVKPPIALQQNGHTSTQEKKPAKAVESESTRGSHAIESQSMSWRFSERSVRSVSSVSEGSEHGQILAAQFETAFSPTKTALRNWKIPRSKFSVQDLRGSATAASDKEEISPSKSASPPESFATSLDRGLPSLKIIPPPKPLATSNHKEPTSPEVVRPPESSARNDEIDLPSPKAAPAEESSKSNHQIELPSPKNQLPAQVSQPPVDGDEEKQSQGNFQALESQESSPVFVRAEFPSPMDSVLPFITPASPISSTFSIDTKISLTFDDRDGKTMPKREENNQGAVESIHTEQDVMDRSDPSSEVDFLSDDDLMDELQSATVQEAQPISVSKSPIKPLFPTSPKKESAFPRAISISDSMNKGQNQLMIQDASKPDSKRSVSLSPGYLNKMNQKPVEPLVKKVNLGSSISQRIKALEKLSKSGSESNSSTPAPLPASSFYSVRQTSFSGASKSPSVADRANSISRQSPSSAESRDSSSETFRLRSRSESIITRGELFNPPPMPVQLRKSQPDIISVTSRIVRDPNTPVPEKPGTSNDALDHTPSDPKKSPILVNNQKERVAPENATEKIQERELSSPHNDTPKKEHRSSITVVRDLWNETRNSFAERRKSLSIEAHPSSPPYSASKPPSAHQNLSSPLLNSSMSISSRRSSREYAASLSPSSPSDDNIAKPSRATRMLRRLSSSLTPSRKSPVHAMISPTLREAPEPSPSSLSLALDTEIGDVNVQFPDTLLWKRRSLWVNAQGFLELGLAVGSKGIEKSAGTKRFHLSEFRAPFVPELETQELPNSVVLEFIGGSTGLQVACEDRGGQVRVLSILTDAYRVWANIER